ncbi:TonB-dependent receptor [Aquimarina sp. AU119]|uniref:TonB-dependent receptor n=1 Tax=Aquimarina sp. AU119 TaxID=2108528 RepID=UPI000D69152E|nr:carboxypeptidase-like regulatory domain-containing protein [Aquimarina sp. AU119]
MKKITFLFVVILMAVVGETFAQGVVTGTIFDSESNGPLPGANIVELRTSNGTTSDFDGKFSITVTKPTGTINVSYVGFGAKNIAYDVTNGNQDLGTISLSLDNSLEEIVIVGTGVVDLAEDRKTPIAVSTIKAKDIQQKIGTGDVTTALINTPSVYVAGQSGGFGDSRIIVRGFDDTNTAFLLNGQPINSMEDGRMFWSNWSGMSDIANVIQIQRGLGSSKLAISSVGGTVNFVTRATDKREGGFVSLGVANNNYLKTTAAYNTGISENGFGTSVMLSHWQGDGYNEGNFGEGQTYFISFGYKPNDNHNFNFLITGAPQFHDQNFSKSISSYLEFGRRYNNNWGTLGGNYLTERRNFYHKPVANLNWDWNISEKSTLSSVLYASWGRGGGTGNRGNRVRTAEGRVDFDAIVANNNAVSDGIGSFGNDAYIIRASINSHNWYGLVTNFNHQVNDNLSFNVGADFRTYNGTHYRQATDFLGLDGWTEDRRLIGPNGTRTGETIPVTINESLPAQAWRATFENVDEDQRIAWDYEETISYGGFFGQVEYATDKFSTFLQAAASLQSHDRTDRFQYLPGNQDSENVTNEGFNIKAGGSYNINEQNQIFVNAGYYDRQPYHDNIFLNFTNFVNPLTKNEKILGIEAGYQFRSRLFSANVNAYRTSWKDRVTTEIDSDETTGDQIFITNEGVEQLHTGVEIDFTAKPFPQLGINGFASFGNWEYVDNVRVTTRDEELNVLSVDDTDVDGGKVGDAAQFTVGLGLKYQIIERLSIDADWRLYNDLYSDRTLKDNLELPSYDVVDAGISYKMLLGKDKLSSIDFRVNVNNLFYEVYLSELTTANQVEDGDETFNGINVSNRGYFGLGRTWNASIRYNF